MTFLLSEDKALRETISGMIVHDQKADGADVPRTVGVWFGQPDQEARKQDYPYVTIDMIDISRDAEREMRGIIAPIKALDQNGQPYVVTPIPAYIEPQAIDAQASGWELELPIPVNIDYQVTTYARHPRHDREIIAQLLHQKLPLRYGQMGLDDGTVRRIEVMDISKRDVTEQGKRLFVNVVTVRIGSEVVQKTINELYLVQERILQPIEIITTTQSGN